MGIWTIKISIENIKFIIYRDIDRQSLTIRKVDLEYQFWLFVWGYPTSKYSGISIDSERGRSCKDKPKCGVWSLINQNSSYQKYWKIALFITIIIIF